MTLRGFYPSEEILFVVILGRHVVVQFLLIRRFRPSVMSTSGTPRVVPAFGAVASVRLPVWRWRHFSVGRFRLLWSGRLLAAPGRVWVIVGWLAEVELVHAAVEAAAVATERDLKRWTKVLVYFTRKPGSQCYKRRELPMLWSKWLKLKVLKYRMRKSMVDFTQTKDCI